MNKLSILAVLAFSSLFAASTLGCAAEGDESDEDESAEENVAGSASSALCATSQLSESANYSGLTAAEMSAYMKNKLETTCRTKYRGTPTNFEFYSARGRFSANLQCRCYPVGPDAGR